MGRVGNGSWVKSAATVAPCRHGLSSIPSREVSLSSRRERKATTVSIRLKRVVAASVGVTVALATAGVVAMSTGTAYAAGGATYNGKCGQGYSVIDRGELKYGTVFLTYSESTGMNCVVTVRTSPGDPWSLGASIETSTPTPDNQSDSGRFTTYAGPVYVYAPHTCINWGGWIWPGLTVPDHMSGDYHFTENVSHCG